jgi:hypothetical protein
MILRVYFNRSSEAPYVWSVDEGDISTEKNYISVEMGPNTHVITRYDQTRDNVNDPRAWLEVDCKMYAVNERGAVLL